MLLQLSPLTWAAVFTTALTLTFTRCSTHAIAQSSATHIQNHFGQMQTQFHSPEQAFHTVDLDSGAALPTLNQYTDITDNTENTQNSLSTLDSLDSLSIDPSTDSKTTGPIDIDNDNDDDSESPNPTVDLIRAARQSAQHVPTHVEISQLRDEKGKPVQLTPHTILTQTNKETLEQQNDNSIQRIAVKNETPVDDNSNNQTLVAENTNNQTLIGTEELNSNSSADSNTTAPDPSIEHKDETGKHEDTNTTLTEDEMNNNAQDIQTQQQQANETLQHDDSTGNSTSNSTDNSTGTSNVSTLFLPSASSLNASQVTDMNDVAKINELDSDDINPDFYTSPLYNLLEQQFLLQKQQDQLQFWRQEVRRRYFINRARQLDLTAVKDNGQGQAYYEDRRAFIASADNDDDEEAEVDSIVEQRRSSTRNNHPFAKLAAKLTPSNADQNEEIIFAKADDATDNNIPAVEDVTSEASVNDIDDDKNPDFYTDPEYDLLTEQYNLQHQDDELDRWQGAVMRQWLINRQRQFSFGRQWENGGWWDRRTAPV